MRSSLEKTAITQFPVPIKNLDRGARPSNSSKMRQDAESIKEVPRPQTKVQSPLKMPGLVPVDYVWFFVVFTLNDSRS